MCRVAVHHIAMEPNEQRATRLHAPHTRRMCAQAGAAVCQCIPEWEQRHYVTFLCFARLFSSLLATFGPDFFAAHFLNARATSGNAASAGGGRAVCCCRCHTCDFYHNNYYYCCFAVVADTCILYKYIIFCRATLMSIFHAI